MKILVLNCGSSSIKYSLWALPENIRILFGVIECINVTGSPCKHKKNNEPLPEDVNFQTYRDAIGYIIDLIKNSGHSDISAIGHRVVHGGEKFKDATLVTEEVKEAIGSYFDIAPLHNPSNLEGIIACQSGFPGVPNVAVFDTAFHQTIGEIAATYAIPRYLAKKYGIRKYGYHGISHKYVWKELTTRYPEIKKVISCHLGNGSSITAIRDGKSVDTSMGFSPLEGLVMGTRPGDVDPEILLYLMEKEGLKVSEMVSMLNRQCGVVGISGISSDMRNLVDSDEPSAKLAVDVYCYRIKKYIGAYIAILNGCDAIIFTGGIGENSPKIRSLIAQELDFLNIKIDSKKNLQTFATLSKISSDDSKIQVFVVPTNEELMIARETYEVVTADNFLTALK